MWWSTQTVFVRFGEELAVTFETAWASNMNSYMKVLILGSKGGLQLDPVHLLYRRERRTCFPTKEDISVSSAFIPSPSRKENFQQKSRVILFTKSGLRSKTLLIMVLC